MTECYNGTRISEGNMKMGPIPSFSTMPGLTCRAGVPCNKKGEPCYAARMCARLRNVAESWSHNTDMMMSGDMDAIADDVVDYVRFAHAKRFRWFVGGDIYCSAMLDCMVRVADACPDTEFLAFTKCYDLLPKSDAAVNGLPANLHIVLSVWKSYRPSEGMMRSYPVCYYDDGTKECDIPDGVPVCGGGCDTCGLCYHMRAGDAVRIKKH